MYRLLVFSAVLPILAGCASSVPEPGLQASNDLAKATPSAPAATAASELPGGAPTAVVDIEDFKNRTVCKNVMRTGTRIVVDKQCYSIDDRSGRQDATANEAALRQQQELTRAARERDLDYQRPVLTRGR
jgi:hypothetical protein